MPGHTALGGPVEPSGSGVVTELLDNLIEVPVYAGSQRRLSYLPVGCLKQLHGDDALTHQPPVQIRHAHDGDDAGQVEKWCDCPTESLAPRSPRPAGHPLDNTTDERGAAQAGQAHCHQVQKKH